MEGVKPLHVKKKAYCMVESFIANPFCKTQGRGDIQFSILTLWEQNFVGRMDYHFESFASRKCHGRIVQTAFMSYVGPNMAPVKWVSPPCQQWWRRRRVHAHLVLQHKQKPHTFRFQLFAKQGQQLVKLHNQVEQHILLSCAVKVIYSLSGWNNWQCWRFP